jgi:hypothetical protein
MKCENCNQAGLKLEDVHVQNDMFVGRCCVQQGAVKLVPPPAQVHVLPAQDDVEYGVEISNKVGIRAYANYHGLQVSFERTPRQLQDWAEKQGLLGERQTA